MEQHKFNMLNIYKSEKQLPVRQKFSYQTAQEYCQLVQRSIKKQRSISRQDKKLLITSRNIASQDTVKQTEKSKDKLRHIAMRSKISERSSSVNDRSQSGDKSIISNSKNNLVVSNNRRKLPPTQRAISRKNITSYEQQHLIINLQEENKTLSEAINNNETKIMRIKTEIEDQRSIQEVQREMYLQQVKKLRDTLERQCTTRSTTRLDEDQCSFGKELSEFSELTQ